MLYSLRNSLLNSYFVFLDCLIQFIYNIKYLSYLNLHINKNFTSTYYELLTYFIHPISITDTAIRAAASGVNSDIRHLASSAKTLYELEGVLASPALLEVLHCSTELNYAILQSTTVLYCTYRTV